MGELESIRIFLTVAELGSFVGAARQIGLSPAQVTRAVAGIEKRLGVQLLVRTTRQVSLTSAGAVYAARVASLVDGLAEAAEETRDAQGLSSGQIRLSAPVSLGLKVLPAILSKFASAYPETWIALSLSDHFIDIVEGDHDLAIRISGPPTDKSTIWRKICPVPRVMVASPACLAEKGPPGSPDDLIAFNCLSYATDALAETWELTHGTSRRTHQAAGRFGANNGDILASLARKGAGIALLPRFIVEDDLATGRLVEILPDWSAPEIWLTLYYPPYDRLPVRVAAFSDFFEACMKEGRSL